MRKGIRILFLSVLFAAALLFAGCNGTFHLIAIDTMLSVDKSFNGSRVMKAEIPAAVYKKVFNSDASAIEEVISGYTPGSMYCKAQENDAGGATIEMHIDFASLAEYQKEVKEICKGSGSEQTVTPSVTFDYSKSMLKSGYTISENFTSLDLFGWLSQALEKEYPALAQHAEEGIFELGSTKFFLSGEEIALDGSGKIQASEIESHAFDGITIETTVNSDDTIDANIRYAVGAKVVADFSGKDKSDRLESLMKDLVPKDGSISSLESESGGRIFRIKFTSATPEAYIAAMNKALATNNTVFSASLEGDEEELSVKETYRQYYDGSYFLDYNNKSTNFSYILRVPTNYSLESCKGKYGFLKEYDSTYTDNKCEISMALSQPDEVSVIVGYIVDLDAISVSTQVDSEIKMQRSVVFKLTNEEDSLIGSRISGAIDQVVNKWPKKAEAGKDKLISSVQYSITMNAESFEELTRMTRLLLQEDPEDDKDADGDGRPESSRISGGETPPHQPVKRSFEIRDTINFSGFLKGSKASEGISYKLVYPARYTAKFDGNTSFENAAAQKREISCITNNKIIAVNSSAEKWNIEGIVVLSLCALSFLIFLIILFFRFTPILVFLRDGKLTIDGKKVFSKRGMAILVLLAGSLVCFIVMGLRLIFQVY